MKKFFKKIWDTIGFWVLISPFVIVPLALIVFSVVGTISKFSEPETSEVTEYEEGYNDGYFEGRDLCKEIIADTVESDYFFIYSSKLDDVITALSIYADGIYEEEYGEPMSEEELQSAIQMLLEYQNDVEELIYGIDEIEVY